MAGGTGYRRGSVFGALMLIGVGGLFLYANLHPEFSAWPVLARYWPVLIIFWGLSKLVDYLMLRGRPEAAAAARLSGGDIIGLLFLLLVGTAFSQVVNRGWWRGAGIMVDHEDLGCLLGNEYQFSDQLTEAITPPAVLSLRLENERGNVTLSGGAESEIRVVTRKTVCATSEAEAERLAKAYQPVLEQMGAGYAFHWQTQAGEAGAVRANLDFLVPGAVNVELSGGRGDVRVSGLQGDVNIALDRGDTTIEEVGGTVRVKLRRGSVKVDGAGGAVEVDGRGGEIRVRNARGAARVEGSFYGPLEFASIAGPVQFSSRRTNFSTVALPGQMVMEGGELTLREAAGDVTLLTRDYEITVEDVEGQLRLKNRNGRVEIRSRKPPTGPIDVENRSGGIELALPASSSFAITAKARNGDIESDFTGATLTLREENRGDWTLTGTYGRGQTPIRLSTTHGTIYLRRTGSR